MLDIKHPLILFFATMAIMSFWEHAHISLALLATMGYARILYWYIEWVYSEEQP